MSSTSFIEKAEQDLLREMLLNPKVVENPEALKVIANFMEVRDKRYNLRKAFIRFWELIIPLILTIITFIYK